MKEKSGIHLFFASDLFSLLWCLIFSWNEALLIFFSLLESSLLYPILIVVLNLANLFYLNTVLALVLYIKYQLESSWKDKLEIQKHSLGSLSKTISQECFYFDPLWLLASFGNIFLQHFLNSIFSCVLCSYSLLCSLL